VVPFQLALKPNVVVPLAARAPLYDMFCTVIAAPDVVSAPLHSCVIVCPFANVQRTVQPLIAAVPARTVTSPWNPVFHWLTTR
jgi:hypothetical protein